MKISTATLGFPRIGPNRELKFALERYWKGGDETELWNVAHTIERQAWTLQTADRVTVGDYYLYDGVLEWADALGIVPERFRQLHGTARIFAMARGVDGATALSK